MNTDLWPGSASPLSPGFGVKSGKAWSRGEDECTAFRIKSMNVGHAVPDSMVLGKHE